MWLAFAVVSSWYHVDQVHTSVQTDILEQFASDGRRQDSLDLSLSHAKDATFKLMLIATNGSGE